MLAAEFVPDGSDIDPEFSGGNKCFELGVRAVGETIADAEGVLWVGFYMLNNEELRMKAARFLRAVTFYAKQ